MSLSASCSCDECRSVDVLVEVPAREVVTVVLDPVVSVDAVTSGVDDVVVLATLKDDNVDVVVVAVVAFVPLEQPAIRSNEPTIAATKTAKGGRVVTGLDQGNRASSGRTGDNKQGCKRVIDRQVP